MSCCMSSGLLISCWVGGKETKESRRLLITDNCGLIVNHSKLCEVRHKPVVPALAEIGGHLKEDLL